MSNDRFNVTDIPKPFDISCDMKVLMLPMRDGVKLHTTIYFPPDMPEKAPVLMVRSPYTRTTWFELPHPDAIAHKCIFICQACRGTGWSEGGEFHPSEDSTEKLDAEDTFNWLETQAWFNGHCAMIGGSYVGWTQWCAMRTAHRCLVGTSPRVAPIYGCCGLARPGGSFSLSFINWPLSMYHRRKYGYSGVPDYYDMKVTWQTPVIDIDKFVYDREIPIVREMLASVASPGKFFRTYKNYFDNVKSPAFIAGGWFDGFKPEYIESFQLIKAKAASGNARKFTRLTLGPWGHAGLINPEIFGQENDYRELLEREKQFLFGLLNDPDQDPLPPSDPPVKFFMLGENRWHNASDWPPPECTSATWYLHSQGNANSCDGDGTVSTAQPANEIPDTYLSDPANPVFISGEKGQPLGCFDRSNLEKRNDILVYTSEKLTSPLAVTGKVKLRFYASASTPDTDFFATLTLLTPDGKSYGTTTGMIRARYRNSFDQEELLTPGKIYHYEIDLGDIAVKFMPGYAMRLEIHGQEFPTRGRNHNTGNPVLSDPDMRTCVCTVYHDAEHPAELILPIYSGE